MGSMGWISAGWLWGMWFAWGVSGFECGWWVYGAAGLAGIVTSSSWDLVGGFGFGVDLLWVLVYEFRVCLVWLICCVGCNIDISLSGLLWLAGFGGCAGLVGGFALWT